MNKICTNGVRKLTVYLSVSEAPKIQMRRSSSNLLLRVSIISNLKLKLRQNRPQCRMGFPSTPRYSTETNVNPELWVLREFWESVRDLLNKTVQCSDSLMISAVNIRVYMWKTGHQQLLLISQEERLLYLLPDWVDNWFCSLYGFFSVAFVWTTMEGLKKEIHDFLVQGFQYYVLKSDHVDPDGKGFTLWYLPRTLQY